MEFRSQQAKDNPAYSTINKGMALRRIPVAAIPVEMNRKKDGAFFLKIIHRIVEIITAISQYQRFSCRNPVIAHINERIRHIKNNNFCIVIIISHFPYM
jgi:hypothetical protein